MIKRLVPPLVVTLAAMAAFLGPGASQAFACTEYGVFWKMSTGGAWAYGARNDISLKDHTLYCVPSTGEAGSGQTSRVLLGGQSGNYIEAGYQETYCGGHCWNAFVEKKINNMGPAPWKGTFSCLAPVSTQQWQVNNVAGTTSFDSWLNCYDGAGFRKLTSYDGYPYSNGYAEGEGFHRDSTGMDEIHSNLQWKNVNSVWSSSSGVTCRLDTDPSWNGQGVSATRFDVVLFNGTSC